MSRLLKLVGALVSYGRYRIDRLRLSRLIKRGLKIGKNVYIMDGVEFDYGYPFLIEIGDNCRISKGVRILAHDATTFRDLGVTRIAPVKILEGSFIGERVLILPGVTIGPRALIAAGSVVNRDIDEDKAAAGNPARPYGTYSDLLKKYRELSISAAVFKMGDLENNTITSKDLMAALEKSPSAFICDVPQKDPFYINANMDELRANATRIYEKLADEKSVKDEDQE